MTRCGWGWVVGMAWMLALPMGVRAQQQEPPVDSTRLRLMDRLKLLGRGPGADSALFVQDSIAREEAQNRRPSTAQAPDSTLRALLAMPGFSVTEYDGAEADFSAKDRVLVLRAGEDKPAEVSREGIQVEADTSITYSEQSGQVRTVGNSTFTPPEGEPMESQGLVYDLHGGLGAARGAKTSYQQGQGTWYVRGDMPLATQDSSFMDHATFTSCDLTVPHYHFETDEIKIVGGKILVARPVKLYFADVPVAWLPFMATSLARGRSSGLLTPAFSVNDIVRNSTGYRRRISNLGFYWAMSDYSDAVVALDWFSDNFLALTSSVRYRWNRQFLNGTVNLRQFWRQNGTKELALDTRHSWEMDERTSLRVSGRFVTSTDLITENSFNPAEVTQSITSEGGINRRFDWGTMSVSANRNEYLSDNRVAWTLPSVNLNLSTITLFRAPESRARFYNNMTWSGRAAFNRQTLSREQADTFQIGQADTEDRKASVSSNLSIGNLTFSQSLDLDQGSVLGVPEAYFVQAEGDSAGAVLTGGPARSITDQNLSWSLSLGYLQHLIGSTTITPNVSMSGKAFQSDTSSLASSFISQPSRVSVGATLKTDIYGFFPGFGPYQRIRHKFSPSFTYQWSPQVTPTETQKQVFNARVLQPRNALQVTLRQTFEAKKKEPQDSTMAEGDSTAVTDSASAAPALEQQGTSGEPRRQQRAEIVQLLGLQTSVINYDFVEADSVGTFLGGFQTTTLSNTVTSDFLQGLQLSFEHDLFEDTREDGRLVKRKFSPHLSTVNLGFSLSSSSGIFRLLGLGGGGGGEEEQQAQQQEGEEDTQADFPTSGGLDESSIIPGSSPMDRQPQRSSNRRSGDRSWRANLSYSLYRPRNAGTQARQMIRGTVSMHPTDKWDLSWRTSYDLEEGHFNDHSVRLTRDLHRWEANFDFAQTATGNWQFRFQVSLTDQRDLKFDYNQRNLDQAAAARTGGVR